MAQPGWYPDPSGAPGRFRWFDGTSWTAQTTTDPNAAGVSSGPRRRWLGLVGVLSLVLVLVIAAVVVGVRSLTDATSSPSSTVSGFDDSKVTPTPSPSPSDTASPTPSPSASSPGDDGTVETRPARCDEAADNELPQPANDDRVGGPLSFTRQPSPWLDPYAEPRMPYGRDAWAQALVLPEKKPWAASLTVGVTTFDDFPGTDKAARTMLQCVLTSAYYLSVQVHLDRSTATATTVDGRSATQVDAVISFSDPELTTKGSALRVIVVDTKPATFFFTAVPVERDDLAGQVDQVTRTLRVS